MFDKKERDKFFILGVDDILKDNLENLSKDKIVVRFFTTNELFGPFDCDCGDCENKTFTIRLTEEENKSLPEPKGHRAIQFIFEEKIGLAVCSEHMFHPPISRKNLAFKKFGFGVRRSRDPLSEETKAFLMEEMAQHKEWLRQGEHFKNHSQQRFGGD